MNAVFISAHDATVADHIQNQINKNKDQRLPVVVLSDRALLAFSGLFFLHSTGYKHQSHDQSTGLHKGENIFENSEKIHGIYPSSEMILPEGKYLPAVQCD